MANPTKPIEKHKFRRRRLGSGRAEDSRAAVPAPVATLPLDGRPIPLGHAVETTGAGSPVAVGHGPIPTATGIAGRLGWLTREAALDGTPLTVAGDPLAAPLRDTLLRAAAPPAPLVWEGDAAEALGRQERGGATRLIGLTWVDGYQAVVVAPGGPVTEPSQLLGRRVALPHDASLALDVRRAAARRGLRTALALAGLFPDEVVEVDVDAEGAEPYAAELAALERGEVDAVHVAGVAGLVAATRIGAVPLVDLGAHLDPAVRASSSAPAAVTVDAVLLERRPELVVRLLAVLLRAGAWAHEHPADAARVLADDLATTPEALTAAHGGGVNEQLHVDLSERKLAALREHHAFLRTYGFLAADVDLGAWVDRRPLAAARDLLASERTIWA